MGFADAEAVAEALEAVGTAAAKSELAQAAGITQRTAAKYRRAIADGEPAITVERRSPAVQRLLDHVCDVSTDLCPHREMAERSGCSVRHTTEIRLLVWDVSPRLSVLGVSEASDQVRADRVTACDAVRRYSRTRPPMNPERTPEDLARRCAVLEAIIRRRDQRIQHLRRRPEHFAATAAVRALAHLTPDMLDELEAGKVLLVGTASRSFVRIDYDEELSADLLRIVDAVQRYHDQAVVHYQARWKSERSIDGPLSAEQDAEMQDYVRDAMIDEPYPWEQGR